MLSEVPLPKYSKEMGRFKSTVSVKLTGERLQRPRLPLSCESPLLPPLSSSAAACDCDEDEADLVYVDVPIGMKNVDVKYYALLGKSIFF